MTETPAKMEFLARARASGRRDGESSEQNNQHHNSKTTAGRLAVGASRCLVPVCLFFLATLVVSASSPVKPSPVGDRSISASAPPAAQADAAHNTLSREREPSNPGSSSAQDGEYRQRLPLTPAYYRIPPWSGEARYGFGVCVHPVEQYDVSPLHADWYVVYPGFDAEPPPLLDLEFVQIIRLRDEFGYNPPSREEVELYARTQPGTLWLVGNEPEDLYQDCQTPAQYAQIYHYWYNIIKAVDPSAKVAIGGVVQATPLRMRWLDLVLQAYERRYGSKIPVDVWNVHGFILQEKIDSWGCHIPCGLSATEGMLYDIDDHDNMTIFKEQIVRFRRWMKDNGERNKPLIVSEYGILAGVHSGYDEERVERFMIATFDYFTGARNPTLGYPADGNRMVQAWNWFSLDWRDLWGHESHGHLFDPDTKVITPLGLAYGNYVAPP